MNTKKQCITNTKSKKIVCKDFKCEKRLNFDCKIGYCSIDKQSCESITGIIYSIELLEINNQIFRFNGESQKHFISKIEPCSQEKYVWNSQNFCFHEKLKQKHSSCKAKHSFHCLKDICTINKKECDNLKQILLISHEILNDIVKCSRYSISRRILLNKEKIF